jgi:imidazoleglycerol-phosphate dehydratase
MRSIRRQTRETDVRIALDVRATESGGRIAVPDPVLSHMLETLGRYAGWHLDIDATGDLRHHLIEDVALSLGLVLVDSLPATCARYGHAVIPMDDALVQAAIDLGGRPYYEGPLPSRLYDHFFRSFAGTAQATLHIDVLRGSDRHHIVESAFKAVGISLRQALGLADSVFSTKGTVRIERSGDD